MIGIILAIFRVMLVATLVIGAYKLGQINGRLQGFLQAEDTAMEIARDILEAEEKR